MESDAVLPQELIGGRDGRGLKIAIVVSRFNEDITPKLLQGALQTLKDCRVNDSNVTVVWVPGALELGIAAFTLAKSGRFHALVALGCVIKGETGHYDVVVTQSTGALTQVSLKTGIPIGMGVITTQNEDQAMNRAGGSHGNKGSDAAMAAVEMANLIKLIETP